MPAVRQIVAGTSTITHATHTGGLTYQEDRYAVLHEPEGKALFVFDGHFGSAEVAEIGVATLPQLLRAYKDLSPAVRLHSAVAELGERTKHYKSGSTISAVFVVDDVAYVSYMGDSPVVIVDHMGTRRLGAVHNVATNETERMFAIMRGGVCDKDFRYVYTSDDVRHQQTRSLGCREMGNVLNRTPDSYNINLGPESIIIVCSDGVLDPAHEPEEYADEAIELVRQGYDAERLVHWGMTHCKKERPDNATAIVYRHG